jgi:hypothetical protein
MIRFFFFALLLFCLSCNKEAREQQLAGNYTGVFQRLSSAGTYPEAAVTLNLQSNSFTGSSSNARYPALCHGKWEAGSNTLVFTNSCVWTADFDWTLILDKTFQYERKGDSLLLTRQHAHFTDTYRLVRVP